MSTKRCTEETAAVKTAVAALVSYVEDGEEYTIEVPFGALLTYEGTTLDDQTTGWPEAPDPGGVA